MDFRYACSIVLEVHLPYVKEYSGDEDLAQAGEEGHFFAAVTETLLPLLEVLDRLENDHVPFRLALAVSPVIINLLSDEHLCNKYLAYLDKQIDFGGQELERTKDNLKINTLTHFYYNQLVDRKAAYTTRYEKNILKALDFYKRRGKLEIIASSATHAYLPFISRNAESIQAQLETPLGCYRRNFGGTPQGFWLPELGWTPEIESYLRAYNYSYTITDSHSLLFGNPPAEKGTFYPVKTPGGTFILARDFYTMHTVETFQTDSVYRNNWRDAGFELPPERVSMFLSAEGERHETGYKYWAKDENNIYNRHLAEDKTTEHARTFLEKTIARLEEASKHLENPPICLFAHNADFFGRFWHEGMSFLEKTFRMAAGYRDFQFINPSEYIFRQNLSNLQIVTPEISSWGAHGYAETWLNTSCDYLYRHLFRAMERMTELAERFPDDTGIKERALNQAAREILLAQSSDFSTEYARNQVEMSLRNFTTIYEALGSNYISTEWLTTLEKHHSLFGNINYRVFRRKK